jgi:hypothetical protein
MAPTHPSTRACRPVHRAFRAEPGATAHVELVPWGSQPVQPGGVGGQDPPGGGAGGRVVEAAGLDLGP